MAQLVQLQNELSEDLRSHHANVLVIFREEREGQEGLKKVINKTGTTFSLALDTPATQTARYSPGRQVHDSYIIDAEGVIQSILPGTRYNRAQAKDFKAALNKIAERAR